jgi:hypothetical protein
MSHYSSLTTDTRGKRYKHDKPSHTPGLASEDDLWDSEYGFALMLKVSRVYLDEECYIDIDHKMIASPLHLHPNNPGKAARIVVAQTDSPLSSTEQLSSTQQHPAAPRR